MLYNKRIIKFTAKVLIIVLALQIAIPASSFALTSGPTQPEVQSFEPVGTTNMVDNFTGDFVYNIPLLNVEGYPINIAYHSGVNSEQEASWVGLGWNINPGSINRNIRGIPDDFDGETIEKTLHLKPEKNFRVGLSAAAELFGVGEPTILHLSASLNGSVNFSNYRGVSVDLGLGLDAGSNILGAPSAGINLGVSSQNGADIDYSLGISFASSNILGSGVDGGLGLSYGSGYNSRSGVKARNFSLSTNVNMGGRQKTGPSFSVSVPIGLQNIVPVITNASKMTVFRGQIKLGSELIGGFPHGAVYGMISNVSYASDGSKKAYGYLYAQNAGPGDITDFARDKDGNFNKTMKYLPPGSMAYDVYSATGQGTGGSFRPYRNDFGSIYDPVVSTKGNKFSLTAEAGFGDITEVGADGNTSHTVSTSGPWEENKRPFTVKSLGSVYENVYFKKAGEATAVDTNFLNVIHGITPITGVQAMSLPLKKPGSENARVPRGDLLYYYTGGLASEKGVASSREIYSYDTTFGNGPAIPVDSFSRENGTRNGHQISEFVDVKKNGRKYIYGLPAMNNRKEAVSFSIGEHNTRDGLIHYNSQDTTDANQYGRGNFCSKTVTPAYAYSYLLTAVESPDYVDVTGNGPSDDDLGTWTKFNYSLRDKNYHWKAPYGDDSAQYNPGFKSDPEDNKASFLEGNREEWYLHSIETRNYIAEFYTSKRADAKGEQSNDYSYELDSIKLYNKHDRFINKIKAVPIKTVIFKYDYSLCPGTANSTGGSDSGKLTLRKIYIRFGNSDKNMISPYQFDYEHTDYTYGTANKDRWGSYKPNTGILSNTDFPFVNQNDPDDNNYAAAWELNKITLPSGGTINVQYESDDYAYVQNRLAMEMFMLQGVGRTNQFIANNQLYLDKKTPCLYYYFKRRKNDELSGLSFKDKYLKGQNIMYYNFDTRLVNSSYEPIKGFADIEDVGICPNNTDYGYVKVGYVVPKGGGAHLNPSAYTAINFARYYLPQVVFPGNDPNSTGIYNVLSGLKYAFGELLSIAENPVKRMVKEGKAKSIKLNQSYIRLTSPGRNKKGGGLRVKELTFSDNWAEQAGGKAKTSTYGKTYAYTTLSPDGIDTISSGVASYEPLIGGDENPFRMPARYNVQSASNFPPNDPVGVYRDLPVGETFFPSPVVGYSKVTVKSIHQQEGRSSQAEDIYDFYTAKDFPIQIYHTPIKVLDKHHHYSFINQDVAYKATQGYTLVFNDMHGKPKKVEHRVIKPETGVSKLISYTKYNYFEQNNKLNNKVSVVKFDSQAGKLKITDGVVGYEEDLTMDSREKKDVTHSETGYFSLNVFILPFGLLPVPVFAPFGYAYPYNYKNQFDAAVATKIVQQYGILKSVESYQDGALTTVNNIAFDPVTGRALITSVNNEFKDRQYSVQYPAWWGYKAMGPSYENIGYKEGFDTVEVSDYEGELPTGATVNNYRIGDELFIAYNYNGNRYTNNVWVSGFKQHMTAPALPECYLPNHDSIDIWDTIDIPLHYLANEFAHPVIKPRFKYQSDWPANGTLTNVEITVVRSGDKNQLDKNIQSYTSMEKPFDNDGYLKDSLNKLINISAKEYSDTLTAALPQFDSLLHPSTFDSLNKFVTGQRGLYRLYKEYAYIKHRDYTYPRTRSAGLFSAITLWHKGNHVDPSTYIDSMYFCRCLIDTIGGCFSLQPPDSDVMHLLFHIHGYIPNLNATVANSSLYKSYLDPNPADDPNWVVARTVTKYSPWGFELENKDAIGNYTTAQYGYNNQLPVALAKNAQQGDMMADNFEDYKLLELKHNRNHWFFSPFHSFFGLASLTSVNSPYGVHDYDTLNLEGTNGFAIESKEAHTGDYALATPATDAKVYLHLLNNQPQSDGPELLHFMPKAGQTYVISYWFRPKSATGLGVTAYTSYPSGVQPKSNIIDGWQQLEGTIAIPATNPPDSIALQLPEDAYIDDIRIYPIDANMKSFVYNPFNQRLMATLDENNFATFYEYDKEGNLVRTKKETEKGIMTIMESRSAHPNTLNQ